MDSAKAMASEVTVVGPRASSSYHVGPTGMLHTDGWIDCYTGSSFLPHMITVNAGEDISSKIMEFSLQGPRSVCVISGSGVVSSVTIRHPSSSGGTLTYEGLFEIISFSGSFSPVEVASSKFGRSGMISISLSGADGRVVGGLVAGLTIAATPVKVIVASFLLSSLHELKPKKQKSNPLPFTVNEPDGPNEKKGSHQMQGPSCSTSNHPSNWAETSRKATADINISLQG